MLVGNTDKIETKAKELGAREVGRLLWNKKDMLDWVHPYWVNGRTVKWVHYGAREQVRDQDRDEQRAGREWIEHHLELEARRTSME
jgi:hypothetical protein